MKNVVAAVVLGVAIVVGVYLYGASQVASANVNLQTAKVNLENAKVKARAQVEAARAEAKGRQQAEFIKKNPYATPTVDLPYQP